ncbi:MAG: ATP-dependent metallopeptidase FtsH/Yme1/Tma family protein [Solirubrobacterales bacterium]
MNNKKLMLIPVIAAVISIISIILINIYSPKPKPISYQEFTNSIAKNEISLVYLTDTPKIKLKMKNGDIYETENPRTMDLKASLLKSGIEVFEHELWDYKTVFPITALVLSACILIVMIIKFSRSASKDFLGLEAKDVNMEKNLKYNFESIAGNEEAKESVMDIVDFLKNPDKYSDYGARMPKGIIFYGEPGTGKTLLAKAVAGEAGVPFFAMSGSDFVQVYVGVGASRIRQLFKKARKCGKAVIFIDEIDAMGKKREGSKSGGSDERDQTLNALLTEMSGFNEKEGIIVMAATNRLDMLDSALLRPGRFDRHIEIMLPDLLEREKIIKLHLKGKPTGEINVHELARKTSCFSGAKLESMINESAILACKEGSSLIEDRHIEKAFSIVLAGYEKKNYSYIKETDRKITAYHEAGHALVMHHLLPSEKISKVTIIPSTKGAGGYTLSISEDSLYQNKDYLTKKIMVLLAGRAAEEISFGTERITTGAYNDLKHSTNTALCLIAHYGMGSSIGLLTLEELAKINISHDKIAEECKFLVDDLYSKVKLLIKNNKNSLEHIAAALLEKETLNFAELESIFSNKTM